MNLLPSASKWTGPTITTTSMMKRTIRLRLAPQSLTSLPSRRALLLHQANPLQWPPMVLRSRKLLQRLVAMTTMTNTGETQSSSMKTAPMTTTVQMIIMIGLHITDKTTAGIARSSVGLASTTIIEAEVAMTAIIGSGIALPSVSTSSITTSRRKTSTLTQITGCTISVILSSSVRRSCLSSHLLHSRSTCSALVTREEIWKSRSSLIVGKKRPSYFST